MQALSFRLELQPREEGANMKLFPAVGFIKQALSVTSAYILYKISKHDLILSGNSQNTKPYKLRQTIMILDKVDLSHIASAFKLRGYSSCSPASLSIPTSKGQQSRVLIRLENTTDTTYRTRCRITGKRHVRTSETKASRGRRTSKNEAGEERCTTTNSTIRGPTSQGRL